MKIESFKVKGWVDRIFGIVIKENEDWIVLKQVQLDFSPGDLLLLKKKYCKKRRYGVQEKIFMGKVTWEVDDSCLPKSFEFRNTMDQLKWLEKELGIIQFQDGNRSALSTGYLYKIKKKKFKIDLLKTNGTLFEAYDFKYKMSKVRVIVLKSEGLEKSLVLAKTHFCLIKPSNTKIINREI